MSAQEVDVVVVQEQQSVLPSAAAKLSTGHAHREAGVGGCLLSGLVCGLLMFVFTAVFSELIFGREPLLIAAVPLGIGMQTMTAMLGGVIFVYASGCRAIIAGPDINPNIFIAEAAAAIAVNICPGGPTDPSGLPCAKADAVLPTVLVATALSTALIGLTFLLLGKFRLTEIVGFFPASVVAGFLSCIGYKVLKASIEVAAP